MGGESRTEEHGTCDFIAENDCIHPVWREPGIYVLGCACIGEERIKYLVVSTT